MRDTIDGELAPKGTILFLTKTTPERGTPRRDLCDRPLRTNQGNVPILRGWAGVTNGTVREALGLVEVVRTTRLFDVGSSHYRILDTEEAELALTKLGWREYDGQLIELDKE